MPFWLVVLAISRDVFIVLIVLLMQLTTGLRRFPPTALGKWTTTIQTVTISVVLLCNYLGRESDVIVPAFFYLTLAFDSPTTLIPPPNNRRGCRRWLAYPL